MKRIVILIAIAFAAIAALAEGKKEEPAVKLDANGNAVVHVDAETQKRMALKVEPVVATQMTPESKGYGRVVDPTTLAAQVNELASAQAAYAASGQELVRLKKLQEQTNASVQAVQSAEAAALHDQLLVESVKDRLLSAWGRDLAERGDLPGLLQTLKSLDAVLVRIRLPMDEDSKIPPQSARLLDLPGNAAEGQFLSAVPNMDPDMQGRAFLFLVQTNENHWVPGEAIAGWLRVSGPPLSGVAVGRDSVVRVQGRGWVYVRTGDEEFTRKPIALVLPMDRGWLVTNGLTAGEKLVTGGAQELLSEETKGASPPGD